MVDLTRDTRGRVRARLLDAFNVVKVGTDAVDACRRRVQQATRGHRGRKGDPLYGIRMLLRAGAEKLTDRQKRRLAAAIGANEAHLEVWLAWTCAQRLRAAYRHPNPVEDAGSPSGSWRPSRPAP